MPNRSIINLNQNVIVFNKYLLNQEKKQSTLGFIQKYNSSIQNDEQEILFPE